MHRSLELDLVPDDRVFDLDHLPEMCVCVDSYPTHDTIQGVIAYGRGARRPDGTVEMEIERVVSFDFSKAIS